MSNNLEDNLCEDEPNEEYWKELAKEREKALNDTLEENRSLCELIQGNDRYFFENVTHRATLLRHNSNCYMRPS